MKTTIPAESYQLLDSYHQDVVSYLKAMSTDAAQDAPTLHTQLQAKLTDLKTLEQIGGSAIH